MPGPQAGHEHWTRNTACSCNKVNSGKTDRDKKSGKWARRLVNRHRDPVRERGGKQFQTK